MTAPHIPPATYLDLTLKEKLAILRRWRDQHEDIEAIAAEEGIPNLETKLRQEYGPKCPRNEAANSAWTDAEIDALRAIHRMPYDKQAAAMGRRFPNRTTNTCRVTAARLGISAWKDTEIAKLRELISATAPVKLKAACVEALPCRAPSTIRKKLAELLTP